MSDLAVYDLPFSDLERQLIAWAEEALELRFGAGGDPLGPVTLPPPESGSQQILECLARVRQRLDRVEGILGSVQRARGRVSRAAAVAKALADEAWDEASVRGRAQLATRGPDYTGPRERYADANLASLPQQRGARASARLDSVAAESLDVVRLAQRGLDGLRQDCLTILRMMQFESHLER